MNVSDFQAIRGIELQGGVIEKRSKLLAEFLREHSLADPKSVEYSPLLGCVIAGCFTNVEAQVRRADGRMESGWTFLELLDACIYTVAHAIWITPQGRRKDITPQQFPPERRVLFFARCAMRYQARIHGRVQHGLRKRPACPGHDAF
jgi:hypothetical protein